MNMSVYFTLEPAMPERCRNVSRGLNTVTLTWEDPLKANGILKSYKVRDPNRLHFNELCCKDTGNSGNLCDKYL